MDVKAAVASAKQWLADTLQDESISNVGLEEVRFDEEKRLWLITLGFSRPWNSIKNAFTTISGEPAARRIYRIIAVRDLDGQVVSMTRRSGEDD